MQPHESIQSIDDRIAAVRANIRQLIEQAAAVSGARDEELAADRIAQQTLELKALLANRDGILSISNRGFA